MKTEEEMAGEIYLWRMACEGLQHEEERKNKREDKKFNNFMIMRASNEKVWKSALSQMEKTG